MNFLILSKSYKKKIKISEKKTVVHTQSVEKRTGLAIFVVVVVQLIHRLTQVDISFTTTAHLFFFPQLGHTYLLFNSDFHEDFRDVFKCIESCPRWLARPWPWSWATRACGRPASTLTRTSSPTGPTLHPTLTRRSSTQGGSR